MATIDTDNHIDISKPPKLKFNLVTACFLVMVLFAGLLIWTVSTPKFFIIGGGSTSVQPILDDFTHQYEKLPNGRQPIIYNAIGSAASLTGVQDGAYSFGFLSETVTDSQAKSLWDSHKILRFVIARDYILLVYHLPTGVTVGNIPPGESKSDIYGKHLGFGEDSEKSDSLATNLQGLYNGTKTWKDVFPDLQGANANQKAYGVTREDGSGTRSYFEKAVIKTKNYNFDSVVSSNGGMVSTINNTPGSIGYVSFSFADTIVRNYKQNIQIGAVKDSSTSAWQLPYAEPIKNKNLSFNKNYNLNRPFTGIVNTQAQHFVTALKFIAWMIDPYANQESVIDKLTPANAAYWSRKEGEAPVGQEDDFWNRYNNNAGEYGVPDSIYLEIAKHGFYQYGNRNMIPGLFKDSQLPLLVTS